MSDGIPFEWPEGMHKEVSIEQMINIVNWAIIKGEELDTDERGMISEEIRNRICMSKKVSMEPDKSYMSPFYVHCNKMDLRSFRTFTGYQPKTMIFYSNYCELELFRVAYLLKVFTAEEQWFYDIIKERINTNCFGSFCPKGECFEISIAALRFVSTVFPEERKWIHMYMRNITETILQGNKKIPYQTELYFLQTLYEINSEESLRYMLMLSQCVRLLELRLKRGRYTSDCRRMNEQIIQNVLLEMGD